MKLLSIAVLMSSLVGPPLVSSWPRCFLRHLPSKDDILSRPISSRGGRGCEKREADPASKGGVGEEDKAGGDACC